MAGEGDVRFGQAPWCYDMQEFIGRVFRLLVFGKAA